MTNRVTSAVVVDTMAVSALVNATRQPEPASEYSALIAGRPIVISFATVTELRYGASKAGRGRAAPSPSWCGCGWLRMARCPARRSARRCATCGC